MLGIRGFCMSAMIGSILGSRGWNIKGVLAGVGIIKNKLMIKNYMISNLFSIKT
jgi:hypothetical protein